MKPNAAEREREREKENERKNLLNVKVALVRMYRIEISFC